MLTAVLSGLIARRGRVALTVLAVALGMALVSGTQILGNAATTAAARVASATDTGVSLVVRSRTPALHGGRLPLPQSVLATVAAVPGVAAAGRVSGTVYLVGPHSTLIRPKAAVAMGLNYPDAAPMAAGYPLAAGHRPGHGEVVLGTRTAARYGFGVGQRIRVATAGPVRTFLVVGLARVDGDGTVMGTVALFALPDAQQMLGRTGQLDEIDVAAPPAATAAITAVLPAGTQIQPLAAAAADQTAQLASGLSGPLHAILQFCAVAGLLAGIFLIANTFTILQAQRRRELALLRLLGATRRQLYAATLAEASLLGVLGALLGVALGLAAAHALLWLLSAVNLPVPAAPLQVSVSTAILTVGLGVAATLLATLRPAWRTSRLAPITALGDADPDSDPPSPRRAVTALALAAVAVAALALQTASSGTLAAAGAVLGPLAAIVAAVMLTPYLLPALTAPVTWPPWRPGRVPSAAQRPGRVPSAAQRPGRVPSAAQRPGRGGGGAPPWLVLARGNAVRNPQRSSATIAALIVGVGLLTAATTAATSLTTWLDRSLDQITRADLVVHRTTNAGGIAPDVAAALASRPGIGAVMEQRSGSAEVAGHPYGLHAITGAVADQMLNFGVRSGSLAALRNGGIAVTTAAADPHHWHLGQTIPVTFANGGTQQVPIVAIYSDKRGIGGDLLIDVTTWNRFYPDRSDITLQIKAAPGGTAASIRPTVAAVLADYPQVRIDDLASAKAAFAQQVTRILRLVLALVALIGLMALLGIGNTLALAVLQRTRELGLAHALGLTRRHLQAMVTVEAALLAAVGAVSGILVGVPSGAAIAAAYTRPSTGSADLAIPWAWIAVAFLAALATATLAAFGPARRAARLDPLTALTTT